MNAAYPAGIGLSHWVATQEPYSVQVALISNGPSASNVTGDPLHQPKREPSTVAPPIAKFLRTITVLSSKPFALETLIVTSYFGTSPTKVITIDAFPSSPFKSVSLYSLLDSKPVNFKFLLLLPP